MFLRVDVYPGSLQQAAAATTAAEGQEESSSPPLGPPAAATLHAYPALLAKKKGDDDGSDKTTLIVVGRKEPADVLLPQDKSVSRSHCRFRLGPGGTTVTLENLGKAGCFVVRPIPPLSSREAKDGASMDDGGNDSDATEDEIETLGAPATQSAAAAAASQTQQAASAPADPPLSRTAMRILRSRGLDPALYRFEAIAADQARALAELEQDRSFVIVQCGKLESTLVLSRSDMVVPAKARTLVDPSLLASVGARLEAGRFGPFTHCVANRYSATATMLASWCRGEDFVTPDYFEALAERTGPSDPMPNPDDYRPGLSSQKEGYWLRRPPTWRGWTFVAVPPPRRAAAAEETVEWMRSAGAAVDETVESVSDLERVVARAAASSSAPKLFATTHKSWLTKAQLEKAGVVVCDAKTLASRLTKFQSPDGSPLEEEANADEDAVEAGPPEPRASKTESESRGGGGGGRSQAAPVDEQPPRADRSRSDAQEKGRRTPANDSEKEEGSGEEVPPAKPTAAKRAAREAAPASLAEAEPSSKRPKRAAARSEGAPPPAAPGADPKGAESADGENPSPDNPAAENEGRLAGGDESGDGNPDMEYFEKMSRPRKLAKPAADGWLVTTAAGADRKPGKGRGEGSSPPYGKSTAAVTARVRERFLLQVPLGQDRARTNRPSGGRDRGGADYRGFRKNAVFQAGGGALVRLVSVTPKETEAALHIEAQRRQLEERQRMADELFRDPEFPGGRARSRR